MTARIDEAVARLKELERGVEVLPVIRPFPELAPEALYGLAGEFVRTLKPETEADPVALLMSFHVCFGNLIGRNAHVLVEADQHFANLFINLVGETARGRKGTSFGQARKPMEAIEPEWTKRILSGASSGEGIIWTVRDPIVKRQQVREKGRLTSQFEELIVDPGVDDKRLLLYEGEFAAVLRVLEREGSNLSALLRLAWDRGDLATLTKNSPARATGAHVSILGHITRDELVRHLENTEAANGFANRFLWISVRRSKLLPEGGNARQIDWRSFHARLLEAVTFAKGIGEIRKDAEARRMWAAVYPKLTSDVPGLLGAVTARSEAQVIRLALIYALLDSSREIRGDHLAAALAVWDYAAASAEYIFGESLGDPDADEVLRALRANPEGMTRTAIGNLLVGHHSSLRSSKALSRLAQTGLAVCTSQETAGRPAELWRAKVTR